MMTNLTRRNAWDTPATSSSRGSMGLRRVPIADNVGNLLKWEDLDSWRTPADDFFFVNHFGQPEGLDESTWRVRIAGLIADRQSLSLADLKARPRREVDFTLECSGNNGPGLDFFIGGIGNARWAGASLASVLEEARVLDRATEVILYGADRGTLTIRRSDWGSSVPARRERVCPMPAAESI